MAFILAASLAAAGVGAPVAIATPPACPTAPAAITDADLTDTDRLVRELRELRREAVTSCGVTRTGLMDITGAGGDLVKIRTGIDLLKAADVTHAATASSDAAAILAAIEDQTAPVGGAQTVTLADDDRTWLAATGTAMRADVWVFIGLSGALFFAYFLMRRDA